MEAKSRRKHRGYCRLTAVLLSGAMAVTSCLAGADLTSAAEPENTELQNPRVEMNTCDTVYFGSYWQEDTNGDGVADQNDDKTPIRWRILSKNGNDAYVLADQVLDCKPYHETDESVTWETSTLRKWLNEEFYNTAFTAEEQEAVLEQTLVNADNEDYGTPGGADTVDKVYLPCIADMYQENYGFSADKEFDDSVRIGKATAYAERWNMGNDVGAESQCVWWLRSPGGDVDCAALVSMSGRVSAYGNEVNGTIVYHNHLGIRPALHLDLTSPLVQQGDLMEISLKCAVWDLVKLGSYEGKPIIWRVLQRSENDLFLLSDQILTDREYHESYESISWKDSSLRSWLNGEFYQETFTVEEQACIRSHLYENLENPWCGTDGGEDTIDNVGLLSLEDIINPAYGFPKDYSCEHPARIAYSPGDDESQYGSHWWLRSPGINAYYASVVDGDGEGIYCEIVDDDNCAVRPTLHFDLSAHSLTKVGTVTATAEGNEYQGEVSNPTDQPETTQKPGSTDKPDTTQIPSATDRPDTTQNPATTGKPNTTQIPSVTDKPDTTDTPAGVMPTNTPSGTTEATSSSTTGTTSVTGSARESAKNQPTKLNIKNKKKYPLSKMLIIQDADGIRSVKLNGKTIKIKSGKKKISFKFSKYKKKLKKKGKWNKLVVIDQKGKKTTVKFKIK